MTLFLLILLLLGETILELALAGVLMQVSKFKVPLCFILTLIVVINGLFLAWKFWLLFHVWYATFVIGIVAIAVGFFIFALVMMVAIGAMSPEKNTRANVLSTLNGQSAQGLSFQALNLVSLAAVAVIIWLVYSMSRHPTPEVTRDATFLYFTIGALPGLLLSCIRTSSLAMDRTIDPIVRNLMAINAVGGYGAAAWRAAFPFLFLGGTTVFLGYEINLLTVLVVMAAAFVLSVVIPVVIGAMLYKSERDSVLENAKQLYDQVAELDNAKLDAAEHTRTANELASAVDEFLQRLLESDVLLRFLVFWRWGPNSHFTRQGNFWVLGEPDGANVSPDFHQPASVLERAWFTNLIGPKRRFECKPLIEGQTTLFLKRIPTWNYRAAVFDEFVPILEALHSPTPANASGLARIARAKLPRAEKSGGSVIAILGQAIGGGALTGVLGVFKEEIATNVTTVLRQLHLG